MTKFIVLYRAPSAMAEQQAQMSKEQIDAEMDKWMQWAGACGPALADMGAPLGNSASVTSAGSSDSDSDVSGYSVIEAESREAAVALLEGHPHLNMPDGCSIEVLESLPLPGS